MAVKDLPQSIREAAQLSHLLLWTPRIIRHFHLPITPPTLMIQELPQDRLAEYCIGEGRITISQEVIHRGLARTIETLTHELAHRVQARYFRVHGVDYHDGRFRGFCTATFGLRMDAAGAHVAPPLEPFQSFLRQYGVEPRRF